MKSIVIVNPTGYLGYGYVTMVNKFFSEYVIIGLWTNRNGLKTAVNSGMHLIDMHFVAESNEEGVEMLKNYNPECFLVGNDAAFALADYLQCIFFPNHSNDPDKLIHRVNRESCLKYLTEQNVNISTGYSTDDVEYNMEICTYNSIHRCTLASIINGRYTVDSSHTWYEENELVDPSDSNLKNVYNYVVSILDILGIKIGLTWTKVKISNGIPSLVSINFRGQDYATIGPIFNATGHHWAMESLRAYLNLFTVHPLIYKKLGDFNKIYVNNHREKLIERMNWPTVMNLPGVAYCETRAVNGKICPVTTDVSNVLGVVILQNNDPTLYQLTLGSINSWKRVLGE